MKSRIIFQNGSQTEEATISNLKEQFFEMFTDTSHISVIGLSQPFAPLEDKNNNEFVTNELTSIWKSYSQNMEKLF